ncbi:MAG: PEP-CTERM sorting domain-containing protein [Phycisphaeraceae bacterium]|nr:PEP-CTERM sorting domain-containing protein [Phycisphaerae bacterium]MBX3392572.1 PEP-CTERM sorting domain-containing protein [Phycisphaeraceae bacterium]HRJ51109.1 PEP-CTERM sorting domain-containing protein [Phycisphaerales bacterium]
MKKMIAALAVLAGAATANAAVLAANPQDFGPDFGLGYYSDGNPGYFYSQQIAENFSLGSASVVTGVNFAGASEFYLFPDYTNMSGWRIQIFSDAGGIPGAVLHNEVVPKANTNPVLQGVSVTGSNVYGQSVTLNSAVNLGAGNYWLSIGGVLISGGDDAWVWANGTVADGIAYTFSPNAGGWVPFQSNFSGTFEIIGVPAPASLALVGMGALVVGRRRR